MRRSSSSRPIYHIPRAAVKQATTESHSGPLGGCKIVTNLAKHFGVPLAQFMTSMASTLIRHKQLVMRKSFQRWILLEELGLEMFNIPVSHFTYRLT